VSLALPAWSIHLPTADATCVRLRLRPRDPRDPWPFTLAVTELGRLGAVAVDRFRALGGGRGEPVLASQAMEWRACPLHLETHTGGEATLELPSWDELAATELSEVDVWELVDTFAAAVDAERGSIGDGESLGAGVADHIALLVPGGEAALPHPWLATRYRDLPRSGLSVLLR
jgi:hypothetical protein